MADTTVKPAKPKGKFALAVDTLDETRLAAQWGVASAILNDPENADLKEVLDKVMAAQKAGKPIQATDVAEMIKNTNWARQHTSNWMKIQKDRESKDPGIWEATLSNEALKIKNEFTAAGATIDDATARDYAEKMIYGSKWDPATGTFEIYDAEWKKRAIAGGIDLNKTKTVGGIDIRDFSGKAEEVATSLYAMASDYGIDASMSDKAFNSWFDTSLRGVMDGTLAAQDVDDDLVSMAISRNPGLANQIQRGLTLREAADPYLKTIADTLGYSQDQIDLNDDLVKRVLNNTDEKGNFKPLSLYETELEARRDDRFQYTETAKKEKTDIAAQILQDFGF